MSGRRGTAALRAAAGMAVGALTGCGSDASPSDEAPSSSAEDLGTVIIADDGVQEVTLRTDDDYVFHPDRFTVAPGKVRLTVVNAAQEMTIDFEVTAPGDHPFAGTFHAQLGQVGTMTVSQGG